MPAPLSAQEEDKKKTDIQLYRFNIKIYIFLDKLTHLNALGTISTMWLAAEPHATQLVAARGTVVRRSSSRLYVRCMQRTGGLLLRLGSTQRSPTESPFQIEGNIPRPRHPLQQHLLCAFM